MKNLSLIASPYDSRDLIYEFQNLSIDRKIDLREWAAAVEDQEILSSCSAAATVVAYELWLKKNHPEQFLDLSKLYLYYHARLLEDSELKDLGVEYLRSAFRGLHKFGICNETIWPYDTIKFDQQPTLDCYIDAWPRKISQYYSVKGTQSLCEVLFQGHSIVIGIRVFDEFQNLEKPAILVPPKQVNYSGSHAMCLMGYDLDQQQFIAANSWGPSWGDQGYCYISFEYINLYCFDSWYIVH